MRIPASLALVALLAACQSDTAPQPVELTGTWRQSGDLRDVITGDGHIHLGTFALIANADGTFEGTGRQEGACNHAGVPYQGPLTDEAPFQVLNGQVVGNEVTFDTGLCHFEGTFTDDTHWRMTGVARCSFTYQGTDYQFEGPWQADRPDATP